MSTHTIWLVTGTKTEEPIWRPGKSRDLKSSCRVSTNQRPVFPVHQNWTNESTVQIKLKCTFSGYSEYWIYSPLNSNARSGHSVSRESVESTESRASAGTTAVLCPPPHTTWNRERTNTRSDGRTQTRLFESTFKYDSQDFLYSSC